MKKLLLLLFVLFGCENKKDFSKVEIGMTYDEVTKLVDKPITIERGASQVVDDLKKYSLQELSKANFDTTVFPHEKLRSPFLVKLETIGQIIYVNWKYPDTKVDTCYYVAKEGKRQFRKIFYVKYRRCIIFDASSGRVIKTDFFPETIDTTKS